MATVKLNIVDGLFNGLDTHFERNGYVGDIDVDGIIHIERTRGDRGVSGTIYPDGRVIINNRGEVKKKKYPLKNGKVCGTIGLHTSTTEKYMYFRDAKFQEILTKYGITAVEHEDPNRIYSGFRCCTASGYANYSISTDGSVEEKTTDLRSEGWKEGWDGNPNLYKEDYECSVTGATFVIEHIDIHYADKRQHNVILHTLKSVENLDLEEVSHE